jgi:hypothetical protein
MREKFTAAPPIGSRWRFKHGEVRVMAAVVADGKHGGWAMVRYRGCVPFVVTFADLLAIHVECAARLAESSHE